MSFPASTSSRVVMPTLTLPDATAAGVGPAPARVVVGPLVLLVAVEEVVVAIDWSMARRR